MEKFRAYYAIEEFMKYYAAGANKYPELMSALSRPLKQFSDYYTHNDLLSRIVSTYKKGFQALKKNNCITFAVVIRICMICIGHTRAGNYA